VKIEMNSRISLKFFLGLAVLSCSLPGIARAQYQAPDLLNPDRFCKTVQKSVSELPLNTDVSDWPTHLKMPGLAFPDWKKLNPATSLGMIEESFIDMQKAGYNTNISNPDFAKKVLLNPEKYAFNMDQNKRLWDKYYKPIYVTALFKNQLEYETVNVTEALYQTDQVVAFRFRVKPNKKIMISNRSEHLMFYNDWQYVLRRYSAPDSFVNVPVFSGTTPYVGELAEFEGSLVIFDSDIQGYGGLYEILIPPDFTWDPSGEIPVSGICSLSYPK
jgi:hypothetical protein